VTFRTPAEAINAVIAACSRGCGLIGFGGVLGYRALRGHE
jgi:hypothetical protein